MALGVKTIEMRLCIQAPFCLILFGKKQTHNISNGLEIISFI